MTCYLRRQILSLLLVEADALDDVAANECIAKDVDEDDAEAEAEDEDTLLLMRCCFCCC